MTLQRFDEAITKKIRSVFPNVDFAFEERYSEESTDDEAKLVLPLITIWRVSNNVDVGHQFSTHTMSRRGFRYSENPETNSAVKTLPMTIVYQIDIISDRRQEVDDILRELAMFLLIKASLTVYFDVGDEAPVKREFTMRYLDNQTNSDYGSVLERGHLYRESINLEIPNAELLFVSDIPSLQKIKFRDTVVTGPYIKAGPDSDIEHVEGGLYVKDKTPRGDFEEIWDDVQHN